MNWILTHDGDEYHLDGIRSISNDYNIETIGHALSHINRFTGHTSRPYSVAEHSLLVARILEMQGHSASVQMAGLMHDAHEAYIGDVSAPLKWTLGRVWRMLEDIHARALRAHYGLRTVFAGNGQQIHQADLIALATERRDLTAYRPGEHGPWLILDKPGAEVLPLEGLYLGARTCRAATTPAGWRDAFLAKFKKLQAEGQAQAQAMMGPAPAEGGAPCL